MVTHTDVARRMFELFLAKDAAAASDLISDDFVFTSPQDDHIDKAAYFERCFPTADHFATHRVMEVIDATADIVFVRYEYSLADGTSYRNTEAITVRDGLVREVEVYFGGAIGTQ